MTDRYLDFELQIERSGVEGQYLVAVVASPAGETQRPLPIPFPFDDRDLERLQLRLENALLRSRTRSRRALTPEEKEVRDFDRRLFEAVQSATVPGGRRAAEFRRRRSIFLPPFFCCG